MEYAEHTGREIPAQREASEPLDLTAPPPMTGSVLTRIQPDPTKNGVYRTTGEPGDLAWVYVRWTEDGVRVRVQPPEPGDGDEPQPGTLYALPDASGITWGTTPIVVTLIE